MVPGDYAPFFREVTPVENGMNAMHAAEEPRALCIIRDMTNPDWQSSKMTLNLPVSNTASQLTQQVAQHFHYEATSFELVLQSLSGDSVVVSNKGEDTLADMEFQTGKGARNNLIVAEKNGEAPRRLESVDDTNMSLDDLSLGASASPVGGGEGDRAYTAPAAPAASYSPLNEYNYSYSAALIKQDTGYVGLVNQAMTCYLNSLLQTLYMTPEFRNALYRWEFDKKEDPSKSIPNQLQKLFLQLQTSKRHAVETTELTRSFGWDSSEAWQQHDVQELCRVMFDALELKFRGTDQSDLINHLYQGKLKDYVKCLECGYESAREDTYLDIPLPVRPFGQTQAYSSVEEALRAFVQPEVLDESNQYSCERCNKKCDAHKGLKFIQFPYLLTLQLKRFDFDYNTMHRIKLNDKVTFPELLNLNSFIKSDSEQMETSDDASTTDSGSALDDDLGAPANSQPASMGGNDTQDDDEGIDLGCSNTSMQNNQEVSTNEKNLRHSVGEKGPYVYELFSIMVHSGSANGGHYYAYIKSFKDGQWYCFNDQSVTRITYDDIRKTYGGGPTRGYYSGAYSSSTNAYMLMYRQLDKDRNINVMTVEEFPEHIKQLLDTMQEQEERERQQREIERSMCKIKLFCHHPVQNRMIDMCLKVHKDTTLAEATETAYKILSLEGVVPMDRCRLVKYDELHDSLECSFEDSDDLPMGELLGGAKSTYKFDLLMEIRPPDKPFQVYTPGGATVKVYVVNTEKEEVEEPVTVRGCLTQSVQEFQKQIMEVLSIPSTSPVRMVLVKYSNDLRPLTNPLRSLKAEGFYRSNKVFIEYSDLEDARKPFDESQFCRILDRFEHTISLSIVLPAVSKEILERLGIPPSGNLSSPAEVKSSSWHATNDAIRGSGDAPPLGTTSYSSPSHNDDSPRSHTYDVDDEGLGDSECDNAPGCHGNGSGVHSDQSEDSSLTDSDRTLIGEDSPPPQRTVNRRHALRTAASSGSSSSQESCDGDLPVLFSKVASCLNPNKASSTNKLQEPSSKEDQPGALLWSKGQRNQCDQLLVKQTNHTDDWDEGGDGEVRMEGGENRIDGGEEVFYFKAFPCSDTDSRNLQVLVDKRITLGTFKKELEPYVGVAVNYFKVFRLYGSNQEFECSRLNENLVSFSDDTKVVVRLGRVLRKGEYNVKIYQLQINEPEPAKFLLDWILCKGMTVLDAKKEILPELAAKCGLDIPLTRCRLRKKSWRTPGPILLDHRTFDDDIPMFANWEAFVEILPGSEPVFCPNHMAVFVRRWRPSAFQLDPFQEIVLDSPSVEDLKQKLTAISGIPPEEIDFAKGQGTFPCEMSLLTIHKDLDWNPQVVSLNTNPLYICDDGHVVYYKDAREELKLLSEDERREITNKEHSKLHKVGRGGYSPRKERALKIYTDVIPLSVTSSSASAEPDVD